MLQSGLPKRGSSHRVPPPNCLLTPSPLALKRPPLKRVSSGGGTGFGGGLTAAAVAGSAPGQWDSAPGQCGFHTTAAPPCPPPTGRFMASVWSPRSDVVPGHQCPAHQCYVLTQLWGWARPTLVTRGSALGKAAIPLAAALPLRMAQHKLWGTLRPGGFLGTGLRGPGSSALCWTLKAVFICRAEGKQTSQSEGESGNRRSVPEKKTKEG